MSKHPSTASSPASSTDDHGVMSGSPATMSALETVCQTRLPEPHLAGEFPMSCYACHLEADS